MIKSAQIYRMVTPKHLCPWGIKAWDLLKRNGYDVEDHHLESSEANKAYKEEHGFDETPQIFIDGVRVGGYDALRERLGLGPDPKEGKTYQPVIAIFAITFLMALTTCWAILGSLEIIRVLELFVAISMCVLGILKLQNLMSFATGFIQYDLIARRYVPYSYVYSFVEAGAGILMIGGILTWHQFHDFPVLHDVDRSICRRCYGSGTSRCTDHGLVGFYNPIGRSHGFSELCRRSANL